MPLTPAGRRVPTRRGCAEGDYRGALFSPAGVWGLPGVPRVTQLAPFRVRSPLPVPLGPDDGDASLSVCPAGHSFPVRLPGRQEELGLEDGRLHSHVSPCPLRAGASHWSWGDPHGPSETKRRLLWN